jgi:GNAT superfamily N-acetyltransferase
MSVRALGANDAEVYRALMLEAYGAYPQAFTSSVAERGAMPLSWWEKRLESPLDRLLGAYVDGELAGIVGLAFEPREKARHKVTLFGMYVTRAHQHKGLGRQRRGVCAVPTLRVYPVRPGTVGGAGGGGLLRQNPHVARTQR